MRTTSTTTASRLKPLFITVMAMVVTLAAFAHNVRYYNPPCFSAGQNVTINVHISNANLGTWYHWQYRTSPGGAWTWLGNGNNTINGKVFVVTGASFAGAVAYNSTGAILSPSLLLVAPTHTTQLNGVEFRVLMTDGLDPQFNTVNTWGGEEYLNGFEAKYVRLTAKLVTETCFASCTDNRLVTNPASPTLDTYFGGFEMGSGSQTLNFSAPSGTNGPTTKAYSDMTQWTGGTGAAYRVINNPDSMQSSFSAISPRSGRQMMVCRGYSSSATKLWFRNIQVSNASTFYNGPLTFRAWLSKVDAGVNPSIVIEVRGATTTGGAFVTIAGGTSAAVVVSSAAGNWAQVSHSITLPVNTYKKLQFIIRSSNGTTANVAIDDCCLIEPAAGILPVVLTPLKAAYSGGVAHLTWSSLQESNSSHFDIERSTDGVNFTSLGKVTAMGNSDHNVNYKFDDVKVNGGMNYYRLKLVDKDAGFQYSNIATVNVNIKGITITAVYPNPFAERMNVSIASETKDVAVIQLFDNTGKMVASQQSTVNKGANVIQVEGLAGLAKGFYMMKVQVGDQLLTQKMIK